MFDYYVTETSIENIKACCRSYINREAPAIRKLYNYYNGLMPILNREAPEGRPCNKTVTNFCKAIVDNTIGFMNFADVDTPFDTAEIENVMKDTLMVGIGYGVLEYVEGELTIKRLPATKALVIKDTSLAHNPVIGCILNEYTVFESGRTQTKFQLFVYDSQYRTEYVGSSLETAEFVEKVPHFVGFMPLLEARSSLKYEGLYNHVLSLQDSYNLIDSSYADGRETFAESFLLITGTTVDEEAAETFINAESKVINLPFEGATASYLVKSDSASEVINMLENIKARIHSICNVPDFNSEGDYGVASGKSNAFRALAFYNLVHSRENLFFKTFIEKFDTGFVFPSLLTENNASQE